MAHSSSSEDIPWLAEVYLLGKVSGTGRTATVYRAREAGTDRSLAVKVFHKARIASQELQRREAIKAEVDLHRAVQHGVSITSKESESPANIMISLIFFQLE